MGEIWVVLEHREGALKEISFEMLAKGDDLCRDHGHSLTAVVLCDNMVKLPDDLQKRVDKLLVIEKEQLKHFHPELYCTVIKGLIEKYHPLITLIGHTSHGMTLAPSVSVQTGFPLATDCVDIFLDDNRPIALRQIYGGKAFARVSLKEADGYLMTMRPGAFSPEKELTARQGQLIREAMPIDFPEVRRRFIKYEEAEEGAVDIAKAELLVSIGRGIEDESNVTVAQELADRIGGTLSCSRPVVDKGWLPKYHQVGSSGRSVSPKVYLALGISGAFQHLAGIRGAGTVIAVNTDPKAPIFQAADYGIVSDLFEVIEALLEKVGEVTE
jgi:electron transfer flavoprotein alpha subunit